MNPASTQTLSHLPALQALAAEAPLPMRVRGGCMAPLIADGAWVQIGGPAARYWPGDVVAIRTGGRGLALHRVIGGYWRGGEWRYVTQGDQAPRPDGAVPSRLILGRPSHGECSPRLIQVPTWHRLRALGRFVTFLLIRTTTRLRR